MSAPSGRPPAPVGREPSTFASSGIRAFPIPLVRIGFYQTRYGAEVPTPFLQLSWRLKSKIALLICHISYQEANVRIPNRCREGTARSCSTICPMRYWTVAPYLTFALVSCIPLRALRFLKTSTFTATHLRGPAPHGSGFTPSFATAD